MSYGDFIFYEPKDLQVIYDIIVVLDTDTTIMLDRNIYT